VLDLELLPFQVVRRKLCSTAQMHRNPDKKVSSRVISQSEKSTHATFCSKYANTYPDKAIMEMHSD
jgi:hypothetical protein